MNFIAKTMCQRTPSTTIPRGITPLSSNITQELSSPVLSRSDPDYDQAEALMEQQRVETNSRKKGDFTMKEATQVLEKIARGYIPNATPSLVQALLEYDADVSFTRQKSNSFFKKITGKDQVDIPNDILDQATRNCSSEILFILAPTADERALNQALPAAILMNEPVKASILLASGADASSLCGLFIDAVSSGSDEMVEGLLKETKGACQTCRNKGLVEAASQGHAQKVELLLSKGALVSYDNGAALLQAVKRGHEKIAMSIACHQDMKPHPTILDTAVEEAYNNRQFSLLERCLQAGAKGPATERTLVLAVEQKQADIVGILSRNGASAADNGGKALNSAVESGQCDLVKTILQSQPSRPVLVAAMLKAISFSDSQIAYKMAETFIEAGLCGDGVGEMLVPVLGRSAFARHGDSRPGLLELLLSRGRADVNIGGGEALSKAIAEGQMELFSLMLRYRPSVDSLSLALTTTMNLDNADRRKDFIQAILNNDAFGSLDLAHQDRLMQAAMSAAAKRLLREELDMLANMVPSRASYLAAFVAATSEGQRWLTDEGLEIVDLLLRGGASGAAVDNAFYQAAKLYHQSAVQLLADCVSNAAFDKALTGVISQSEDWVSAEHQWLLEFLVTPQLERGCKGESLSLALIAALRAEVKKHEAEDIIDYLLGEEVQVDVNYNEGEALKIAIRAGSVPLLEKLISSGATKTTLTEAFATAITATLEETQVLNILDVLFSDNKGVEAKCDVKKTLGTGLPPIAACISMHPRSTKLIERLVSVGCDMETKFLCKLRTEKEFDQEPVTLLMWALCSHECEATSAGIMTLITQGADVNFVSPRSKTTPLIAAAQSGRSDIVSVLIRAKANPANRDSLDRSALFYASKAGDMDSVKELVAANSRKNDGSLHEAARNLHHDVVSTLIKAKHDANFASRRHDGRNALQELALLCNGSGDIIRLEDTISALEKGKADVWAKWQGKNALFLALENSQPIPVVEALLESMWELLGSEKNTFVELDPRTGNQFFYSPTMYIKREKHKGEFTYRDELLGMLHRGRCLDRYYVKFPPGDFKSLQPADVVGLPDSMAADDLKRRSDEEKRRAREAEHHEKLRREREEAELKAEIERMKRQSQAEQHQQAQEWKRAKKEEAEMKRRSRRSGSD